MLQACSKHYRPNRLGRVLFMGARGRFAFGRSRPMPSVRKGCLRLAQSGRRKAGRMAAPAGKLTTTAPFFIGGILKRNRNPLPPGLLPSGLGMAKPTIPQAEVLLGALQPGMSSACTTGAPDGGDTATAAMDGSGR